MFEKADDEYETEEGKGRPWEITIAGVNSVTVGQGDGAFW